MGNIKQGNQLNQFLHLGSHWLVIPQAMNNFTKAQINYTCVRNRLSGKILYRYKVTFQNQEQQKVYKYYCQQRSLSNQLVGVVCYTRITTTQLCKSYIQAYVYYQHFAYKLNQINNLLFFQGIYTLYRSLQGFQQLFEYKGYFKVKESLIFINKLEQIKIWLNQDLSKIEPQKNNDEKVNSSEQFMIYNIINMIENKTDQQPGYYKFSTYIKKRNFRLINFGQTISLFKVYVGQLKINIPNCCKNLHERLISKMTKNLSRLKNQALFSQDKQKRTNLIQQKISLSKLKQKSLMHHIATKSKNMCIKGPQILNNRMKTENSQAFSSQKQQNQRIMTLADNLLSETSCSVSLNKSFTPLLNRIASVQNQNFAQKTVNSIKICQFKRNFKRKIVEKPESTRSNVPKQLNKLQKCKFHTIENTIKVDSQIAQDLLLYLQ